MDTGFFLFSEAEIVGRLWASDLILALVVCERSGKRIFWP